MAGRASVTVSGSQIAGNHSGFGGGIDAGISAIDDGAAALTVSNSTIEGNAGDQRGGGLDITASTRSSFPLPPGPSIRAAARVTVTASTISGNFGGALGGGLYFNLGSDAAFSAGTVQASVNASTIDGNSVGFDGGGIYAQEVGSANSTATLTVTNSTLFGNDGGSSSAQGGGLFNTARGPDSTTGVTLLSVTVAFNVAAAGGGIVADAGHFTVRSSIVADNVALFGSGPDALGNFISGGHNLIGNTFASTGFDGGDLTGTSGNPLDPLFGDFGNFGGPTNTLSLLSGSPAIGHGDLAGPATDQRGVARSRTAPSIGAFEFTG